MNALTTTTTATLATARAAHSTTPKTDAAEMASRVKGYVSADDMRQVEVELENARRWIHTAKQMEVHKCKHCTRPLSPKAEIPRR